MYTCVQEALKGKLIKFENHDDINTQEMTGYFTFDIFWHLQD